MRAEFPTTLWTVIRTAGRDDPEAADKIARRYRPAVLSFLRQRGFSEPDSEDLAQDIFLRIFSEHILARADKGRGRFRTLMIAVTKQVMVDQLRKRSAQKRGGGANRIPLEEVPDPVAVMTESIEDADFDRSWIANLLSLAMNRLREECERKGLRYHEALQLHLKGTSYQKIAESFGTSVTNVSTWIRRGRLRLKLLIEEEIRAYSSSTEEFRSDTRYLSRLLSI